MVFAILGARQKIIAPSCLVFGSSAFVALKVTYPDMQPSMRLADEPNPGAIWHNYFLPSPLNPKSKLVTCIVLNLKLQEDQT